jgi:hypothetical protein
MNACPASETTRKTSWDLPGDHLYSIKIRSFPAKGTFQPGVSFHQRLPKTFI